MSKELIRQLMLAYAWELSRNHGLNSDSQTHMKLLWAINEACNMAKDKS
jgi:hypothetical protein